MKLRGKSFVRVPVITSLCDGTKETFGECEGAIIACIWWGALKAREELNLKPTFDDLHPGNTALSMVKSEPVKLHTNVPKKSIYIPGDWLYMKNYNYGLITNQYGGVKVNGVVLLPDGSYPWSGENMFYLGNDKYGGLGPDNLAEDKMREKLMIAYNTDLKPVMNQVVKDQFTDAKQKITEITEGADADSKIVFDRHRRIHP